VPIRIIFLFYPIISDFRKSGNFGRFPDFAPFVLLIKVTCTLNKDQYRPLMEGYWQGKTEVLGKKPCPSATLSATNLALTDMGSNPGFHSEKAGD
jgi:hypothetical protein